MPGAPHSGFALFIGWKRGYGGLLQEPESGCRGGRDATGILRIHSLHCSKAKKGTGYPDRFLIAIIVAIAIRKSQIDFCTKIGIRFCAPPVFYQWK